MTKAKTSAWRVAAATAIMVVGTFFGTLYRGVAINGEQIGPAIVHSLLGAAFILVLMIVFWLFALRHGGHDSTATDDGAPGGQARSVGAGEQAGRTTVSMDGSGPMTSEERSELMKEFGFRQPMWLLNVGHFVAITLTLLVLGAWGLVFGDTLGRRAIGIAFLAASLLLARVGWRRWGRPVAPANDDDFRREIRHRLDRRERSGP